MMSGRIFGISGAGASGALLQTTITSFVNSTKVGIGVCRQYHCCLAKWRPMAMMTHLQFKPQSVLLPHQQGQRRRYNLFPRGEFLIKSTLISPAHQLSLRGLGVFGNFDIGSVASMSGTILTWDGATQGPNNDKH